MESKKKKLNGNPLYSALMKAWIDAYGSKKQQEYNAFWKVNAPHKGATKEEQDVVNSKIAELKLIFSKKKPTLLNFFKKQKDKPALASTSQSPEPVIEQQLLPTTIAENVAENILKPVEIDPDSPKIPRKKPAQDKMNEKLRVLDTRIAATTELKFNWAATDDQLDQLKKDIKDRKNVLIKLKSIKQNTMRQKKHRLEKKKAWKKLKEQDPVVYNAASSALKNRENIGRPSLNLSQPGLLQAIIDVVTHLSSADESRQSEKLNAHLNLDCLHKKMEENGFTLSRTALYLRLLPRSSNSTEGKRHVTTVPVRLLRPQNNVRKYHADGHFCSAFIKYLKDIGEIMGEKAVFYISQDDKAKVPLGIIAANHQSPIVMHVEYRIRLPDHDFPVAAGHKLIPSVYAGLDFKDGKLGYSGPTYIAIRSGKHDSSTAQSHAIDFEDLITCEHFKTIACTESGSIKPIVIIFVDGGPDQNPKRVQTMIHAAIRFKNHNLDAIFIATHAPGHSAYNQVERRMAPLSRDLAGVVLPHQHFGDHISMPDKTLQQIAAQLELEKKNFQKAGEVLAEIWTGKVIDGYEVVAKFKPANESITETSSTEFITQHWIESHVIQSQYSLQIVKCNNRKCCSEPRTNLKNVIGGFMPAPIPFKLDSSGVVRCPQDDVKDAHFGTLSSRLMLKTLDPEIQTLPFDYYCPTVKKDLKERSCPKCSKYFGTKGACKDHYKYCKLQKVQENPNLEPGNSDEEDNEIEFIHIQEEPEPMEEEIIEEMEVIGVDNLGSYYGEIFEEFDVNEAEAEFLAESQMS